MSDAPKPIWPIPIEFIGLTGEFASGKTIWPLQIAEPSRTLVIDTEGSSATYQPTIGFERFDLMKEVAKKKTGIKPLDLYLFWLEYVRAIPAGKFDVIVQDTIAEVETGLTDWVFKNPGHFGHSSAQYARMEGIAWGDVKNLWSMHLQELATKCQTFVFIAHLKDKWNKTGPTGQRKPQGKENLMKLATLYLLLDRKGEPGKAPPAIPAGTVVKTRLVTRRPGGGLLDLVPCLPPRIPVCTPEAIRQYILNPPDSDKLKKAEIAREHTMTDDERAEIALARAEAEKEAASLNLEREREAAARAEKSAVAVGSAQPGQVEKEPSTPSAAPASADPEPTEPRPLAHYFRAEAIRRGMTPDQFAKAVAKRGAAEIDALTDEGLRDLNAAFAKHLGMGFLFDQVYSFR